MSNYLAIATVTESLKSLVGQALQTVPKLSAAPQVKTGRPEREDAGFVGANLYLYQVLPNAALRNDDLATRRWDGALVQRPQIALDLHYLLTFYGKEAQQEPQRLMGKTMTTLQAQPILTREQLRAVILAAGTDSYLAEADLEHQIVTVKFSPIKLSLEELSKIWTVFFQVTHALSVAYEGNIVVMDADLAPEPALMAQMVNLTSVATLPPQLEAVLPAFVEVPLPGQAIALTLQGKNLVAEGVEVQIGDRTLPAQPDGAGNLAIALPSTVKAGLNPVRVVIPTDITNPDAPYLESNLGSLVVRPRILGNVQITPVPDSISGTILQASIELQVVPVLQAEQRVDLLLNELQVNELQLAIAPARGYSFRTMMVTASDRLAFVIPYGTAENRVQPGTYLVRVQVDGVQYAESALVADAQGQYSSPVVQIL